MLILSLLTMWPWTSHLGYLVVQLSPLLNGVNFCPAYLTWCLWSNEIIHVNSFQEAQNAKQTWGNCNYSFFDNTRDMPSCLFPDDLKA